MITLDDFQALKRKVEEFARRQSEAAGEFKEKMRHIREDFGAATLAAAEKQHRRMHKEEIRMARKITKFKKYLEKKWEGKI